MKITFTSGTTAIALADPSQNRHALSIEPAISRSVQVAEFTRADEALPIKRGNGLCRVSFTVDVLHPTMAFAMQASLIQIANTPATGTLKFEFSYGGSNAVCFINNAVLESVSSRQMGATVRYSYQFAGSLPITQAQQLARST